VRVEKAEEATLSLEEAADGFGDGEGPVAVEDWREDLGGELFGKQGGTLGPVVSRSE